MQQSFFYLGLFPLGFALILQYHKLYLSLGTENAAQSILNWKVLGEKVAMGIADLLMLASFVCMLIFGEADLSFLKMAGPYEVGYKEFRTSALDNEVSVYYPIQRDVYRQIMKTQKGANTKWLRHGDKTLEGIARASVPYGQEDPLPWFIFRYLRKIKMDTCTDAPLDPDFSISGEDRSAKPLIPIIFSHGLSSNRTMHSGSQRDLASHGYIVFSIDHKDQSSSYYEDKDGQGYFYCNKRDSHDLDYRKS